MWIRPRTQSTAIIAILDFDHGFAPAQGWVIQSEDATTNRRYYLGWYDGTNFQPTTGAGIGIQITNNVWQNITYTKNGTTLIGYNNGASVYTPSAAANANVSYITGRNTTIANAASFARYFNGDFGTIIIYNRVLSAGEVLQNYNALKSRFGL